MQNQSPPPISNPGELKSNYGQPPGQPPYPGMMPMGHGMPYPPYMMFPMGAPFVYLPPHPDMAGHPPPEMGMDPHFRGQMMPMGYPMPHHPMGPPMMPGGPPHPMQMNPNVAQFVPGNQPRRESVQSSVSGPSRQSEPPLAKVVVDKPAAEPQVAAPKPVSKRLAIIDPTTGEEVSFKPVTVVASAPPASALTPADLVLGVSGKDGSLPPLADSPMVVKKIGGATRLKNAPLVKKLVVVETPESGESPSPPSVDCQRKVLKGIKNAPLVRKAVVDEAVPPTQTPLAKPGKLVNKPLAKPLTTLTKPPIPSVWPIPRELFLKHMPQTKPDRHAPAQTNVFPSELLGLRTAPHGDPGLTTRSGRRLPLTKTMSAVSSGSASQWRSKAGGRTLARQTSKLSAGGRSVPSIVRPSERGFKIIDQSSLSEKEKLRRQTMSLLNKITVDSFKAITEKISEIEITQPWQMDVVIGLIFDKAVVEHSYSEMYAEMCKALRTIWPELEGVDMETGQSVPVTFTRAIIEKCQVEFDNIPDTLAPTEAEIARAKGDSADLEMFMHKKKERILGNMKFIAQLFLMRMISSRVVRGVVEQLLFRVDAPEEHYIECVSILLHNIGATLHETESGQAYITQFVERISDLGEKEVYGKRLKFLMTDLADAAKVGWAGRQSRHVTAAKSKEEVRKDAQTEDLKKATRGGYDNQNRGYVKPTPPQGYRPVAVLRRGDQPVVQAAAKRSTDDSSDESEYAPSLDEEGFTEVKRK